MILIYLVSKKIRFFITTTKKNTNFLNDLFFVVIKKNAYTISNDLWTFIIITIIIDKFNTVIINI